MQFKFSTRNGELQLSERSVSKSIWSMAEYHFRPLTFDPCRADDAAAQRAKLCRIIRRLSVIVTFIVSLFR